MLLFIALANVSVFTYGTPHLKSIDQIIIFIDNILITDRARPLFIFMFMYGMGQLKHRLEYQSNLDWISIRKRLERRGFAMILIGILHVVLLAPIDIIAIYGIMCLIFIDFLRFKDKILWGTTVSSFAFLIYLFLNHSTETAFVNSLNQQNPLVISLKFKEWGRTIIPTILTSLPIAFLGILAARYRTLDEPLKHLKLFKWTALLGLVISILGGLPLALIRSDLFLHSTEQLLSFASRFHVPSGFAGAVGYIALFSWVSVKLEDNRNSITNAIVALGQRSMTFYLFQSFVFISVFAPYAGGWGRYIGQAGAAGVAISTWFISVILAAIMHRYHFRGPAETLLRKITYYK